MVVEIEQLQVDKKSPSYCEQEEMMISQCNASLSGLHMKASNTIRLLKLQHKSWFEAFKIEEKKVLELNKKLEELENVVQEKTEEAHKYEESLLKIGQDSIKILARIASDEKMKPSIRLRAYTKIEENCIADAEDCIGGEMVENTRNVNHNINFCCKYENFSRSLLDLSNEEIDTIGESHECSFMDWLKFV